MKNSLILSLLVVVLLTLAACQPGAVPAAQAPAATATTATTDSAADSAAETQDIVDTAIAAGSFTTLVAAVEAAGLVETLKGEGPFTVFAPSDEAFAKLDQATLDGLLADPTGQLTQILLYHVVPGAVIAADVTDGMEAATVQGGTVNFTVNNGTVMINDANIVSTDIVASNGVIHVIDTVLLPPDATAGAMTDTTAMTDTMAMTDTTAMGDMQDIVDTAVAAGNFTTLVAAVEAAGLVETLKGEGPFTVFAPSDDAFAALPAGTVESLLADPTGALTNILLYHVVPGKVMAADVVGLEGQAVATVGGGTFTVMLDGDNVMLQDGAGNMIEVVTTDIEASNGVIHVISGVLLPE